MKQRYALAPTAFAAVILAGCAGGFEEGSVGDPIPMSAISTSGESMIGEILPIMSRHNPTSTFTLSNNAVSCEGETDGSGVGEMRCSDGRVYPISIPNYPSFSGSYTADYPNETVAIGWGDQSNLTALAALL